MFCDGAVAANYSEVIHAKRETLLELIEIMDGEKQADGAIAAARLRLLKNDQAMT